MLALATRTWIERGKLSPKIGLWWVHGLFLLIAIGANVLPGLWRRWRALRSRSRLCATGGPEVVA